MRKSILISLTVLFLFSGSFVYSQPVSDEAMHYFNRGQAAVEMAKSPADYKDAVKEFKKAAALAPNWPDVYYNIGLIQEKIGIYNDAITNLKKYLKLSPNASDAGKVKKFIAKIEYKMEKTEGFKRVYKIMTSGVYRRAPQGYYNMIWSDYERKETPQLWDNSHMLNIFRMVSGRIQACNIWYLRNGYHPNQHPPIHREWEPVKVNGRFYEYTYSYYMDVASGYVVRYDNEVKGEIISIDPPKVKEISKWSITWGAPIEAQRQPWRRNLRGTKERIVEWRRK